MLVLASIHRPFLHQLQVLLHSRGVHGRLLAYDKTGGRAEWALEMAAIRCTRLAAT
jgi:hypothetical protein